jgi:hemerythrin-like metal-binding protein
MTYACGKNNAVVEAGKFGNVIVDLSRQHELGMALMDDEQRQLFYLSDSMGEEEGQICAMTILSLLCNYVRNHFQDEEARMAVSSPEDEAHRRLHHELRAKLTDLLKRVRMMSLDQLTNEVRNLIHGWLYEHIIMVDFECMPHAAHG